MNWKIGNEFAKLKKLWQRDQSEQGIEWQCETFGSSTWLRSQTQEERGDNLLTGSRNLAFSASSRTRSASCGSSDCWETRRCWTGDWRGCWRCRAASRRSWDPDWTQWTGCSPTWRWWWQGEHDYNETFSKYNNPIVLLILPRVRPRQLDVGKRDSLEVFAVVQIAGVIQVTVDILNK